MATPVCRMIQISDTHLLEDKAGELLGVKTRDSFQAVIDILQSQKNNIDMIIHTGDISQDQSPASYLATADMLKDFNVPMYCMPGNHDDEAVMQQVYPCHHVLLEKQVIIKNWQLILLNSRKPGAVLGYLEQIELAFLEKCLKEHPDHHSIIMFHHHPFSVGSKWLDPIGLTNADVFWEILEKYKNAKFVLFGHVHQAFESVYQNVKCFAVPSTSVQFKPNSETFALDNVPPGYRWLNLYEDGTLETGLGRVAKYVGRFQGDAEGY
ncbi:MAG: 3',5'-cyclic-AMP phosphodiesterase [Gammaproteobacteria bacterium]